MSRGWWVLTALGDSSRRGQVSVLSVHVVGATAGVVTQPDTKVFHLQGGLLVDLMGGQQQVVSPLTTIMLCFFFIEILVHQIQNYNIL